MTSAERASNLAFPGSSEGVALLRLDSVAARLGVKIRALMEFSFDGIDRHVRAARRK